MITFRVSVLRRLAGPTQSAILEQHDGIGLGFLGGTIVEAYRTAQQVGGYVEVTLTRMAKPARRRVA